MGGVNIKVVTNGARRQPVWCPEPEVRNIIIAVILSEVWRIPGSPATVAPTKRCLLRGVERQVFVAGVVLRQT